MILEILVFCSFSFAKKCYFKCQYIFALFITYETFEIISISLHAFLCWLVVHRFQVSLY